MENNPKIRWSEPLAVLVLALALAGCDAGGGGGEAIGACEPGATQCWGWATQVCDDQDRWQPGTACPFGCENGACLGACEDGDSRCRDLQVQRCEGGIWVDDGPTCAHLCEEGRCAGNCSPGGTRCWENVVQRCDEAGNWQNESSCPFVCAEGTCTGECVPGNLRCDGPQIQHCAGGRWTDDGPVCDFGCSAGTCTGVCVPNERRCSGNHLQTCDENGAWQTLDVCPFLCVDGACAGECAPGARSCGGDTLLGCGEEARWSPIRTCVEGCRDGRCNSACEPGTARCLGNVVQGCDPDAQWRDESVCPGECAEGRCLECTVGETRCTGEQVERCESPGVWGGAETCPVGTCLNGVCVVPEAPSCSGSGSGIDDCGPMGDEDCCTSLPVPGGEVLLDNDPRQPAEVSPFRLDRFEVTVGRFREFVEAMRRGWTPAPGDGKHAHLAGGAGLIERDVPSDHEDGWDPAWTARLPADWNAAFASGWNCTWTPTPGDNENKAINCLHWEEAYAFCIWDGGFLPSEAEWFFAAAGGGDDDGQRLFPWGDAPADSDDYAYDADSCGWCMGPGEVGQFPLGEARWGQLDMAGNAAEWVLDWYEDPYPPGAPCRDCANLTSPATMRGLRGGAFWDPATEMLATDVRYYGSPDHRVIGATMRCARLP